MKVLMISGSFYPREGGAERQLRSVLGSLAAQRWRTCVISQPIAGSPRFEVIDGIRVYRVGSLSLFARAPRAAQIVFFLSAILRALALRADALVTLQIGSASVAASLISRICRLPHIVRLTGGGSAAHRSEAFARRASPVGRLLVNVVLRNPRATLVAPAGHLLEDFAICFPSIPVHHRVIPNGVELAPRPVTEAGADKRSGVLWYARRGAETSVDFFRKVAKGCPDVPFTVIGAIPEGMPPNVTTVGWVDVPMNLMWRSKILFATSRNEGSPNTVLQAIAAGCVVVGVENRGLTEIRDSIGGDFRMIAHGDWRAACAAIRDALDGDEPEPVDVSSAETARRSWESMIGTVCAR